MPRLEPKDIQREVQRGEFWPVYWFHGPERMKIRELLARIRKGMFGESNVSSNKIGMNEITLDGTEVSSADVLTAAQSMPLGGGIQLIIIREAHALKEPEILSTLLGPKTKLDKLFNICVFISKDLDRRKNFSKQLEKDAAVVPFEDIPENQREGWIEYLAKRRELPLTPEIIIQLSSLEPWTLDIIDRELEKYSLARMASSENPSDVIRTGSGGNNSTNRFLEAFFKRDYATSIQAVDFFADQPDEVIPFVGLMAWNLRHLALRLADQKAGTRFHQLNPYVEGRINAWCRLWKLDEVISLQKSLEALDFSIKQTPKNPIGLWTELVAQFCRK